MKLRGGCGRPRTEMYEMFRIDNHNNASILSKFQARHMTCNCNVHSALYENAPRMN